MRLEYGFCMQAAANIFDTPAYSGPQAAHYAGIPYATLRSWIFDYDLIKVVEPSHLSFNNLAEAHVLKSQVIPASDQKSLGGTRFHARARAPTA